MTTSSSPTSSETGSWQTLLTLDRESDDFALLARRLLSDQRHRNSEAPQFTEGDALILIELIEPAILQHAGIPGDLKSTAFTMLRILCSAFGRLPRLCLINEEFKLQEEIPFATRGYTDLWKREWSGRGVAVKALRFAPYSDRSEITKRFCKEVPLWKFLNHPNILPFYGASVGPNQLCTVCPWAEKGNILSYTRKNPEANRLRLLIDVADGLKFLHRMNLAGTNIRGSNILISDSQPPRALLGGFDLNTIIFDPLSLTRSSIYWTAPELLAPDDCLCQPSTASDVYALGMVTYEVLTGELPFAGGGMAELACRIVLEDERPSRPMDSEKLGFSDNVWESLRRCWEKEPSARPPIDAVLICLKEAAKTWVVDVPAFMLASRAGVDQVMNLKEDQAKDFADRLDETLDQIGISQCLGKTYLKYLQMLCGASGVLPASFMLTDGFDHIEERPFVCGGCVDVYRATYKGQPVVARALKTTSMDNLENVHKRFAKEVVGWKWLRHENILPFVGVTSIPLSFSMVSAWMENGDIMRFLKATPNQNLFSLLVDVTNGLQYLHQHDFVHGDLKGANILINSERRACLADFGLTAIIGGGSSAEGSSGYVAGGAVRWMAPEILDPDRYGYTKRSRRGLPSKSTDIYALGMTIHEVVTGHRPFEHVERDAAVIQKVLTGNRPDRPTIGFSKPLWALLNKTWLEERESSPPVRPDIADILGLLEYEAQTWSPTGRLLAPPMQMDRTPSSASSAGSSAISGQVVDFRDNFEGFNSEFNDILRDIDEIIGPEQPDNGSENRDISAWDRQTSPIVSSIFGPGESMSQNSVRPQAPSFPLPPLSPQGLPVLPRTKKKSSVGGVWSRLKKSLVKKFWRGGQPLPVLSDLAPERDVEGRLDLPQFPGGSFRYAAQKPGVAVPVKSRMPRGFDLDRSPMLLQNTDNPSSRSQEVHRIVSLFKHKSGLMQLQDLERDRAQEYADTLDVSLDEGIACGQTTAQQLKCLRRICETFRVLPSSLILTEPFDRHGLAPFATGGFSHVYRMTCKGRPVAVKSLVVTAGGEESLQRLHRLLAREVVGWKWLRHENILPFIGVTPDLAIVSDLMEHGNIMEFIARHPRHNRLHILMGAATGLEYLHTRGIVHGDLKGGNILVDSRCSARLADFGLAMIIDESTVGSATGGHETRGTTRWMAPELLYPEQYGFPDDCQKRLPSKGTDVYALGMAVLEVLTGQRPFNEVKREATVILKVTTGVKPGRPASVFSDALWNLLFNVWDPEHGPDPPKRPPARTIFNQMKEDADDWGVVIELLGNPEGVEGKAAASGA